MQREGEEVMVPLMHVHLILCADVWCRVAHLHAQLFVDMCAFVG